MNHTGDAHTPADETKQPLFGGMWRVQTTDLVPGMGFGDTDLEYEIRLETGVLTASKVYEQLAWDTQNGYDALPARCEELPDLFTAAPGQDTGYRCQNLYYACSDGDEVYRWQDMPIGVDEEGFVTFTDPD